MSFKERREFLEIELDAVQQLYNSEKSRRETVRTSLAVPFATLALVFISLNVLVGLLIRPNLGHSHAVLQVSAFVSTAVGVGFLVSALWKLKAIDYEALNAEDLFLDFSQQASLVEGELVDVMSHPDERQAEAEFVAIQGAIYTYDDSISRLRESNDNNLVQQGLVLRRLVRSVVSIVVATTLALAHTASAPYVNRGATDEARTTLQNHDAMNSVETIRDEREFDVQGQPEE